jgi:hypothetical protein
MLDHSSDSARKPTEDAVPEEGEGRAGGGKEGEEQLVPGQATRVEQPQGRHQGLGPLLSYSQSQALLKTVKMWKK